MSHDQSPDGRRRFLGAAFALPFISFHEASAQSLPLTPACSENPARTLEQTPGPFYIPNSPRRSSLIEVDGTGGRLMLSGFVLSPRCTPMANALLDFWHCDAQGDYDNRGFRYRGHLFTDSRGRYQLGTIVPGEYPGRTRHIHVRVQAPGGAILTTQLYFPDEPRNRSDWIYRPELTMQITRDGGLRNARFDFFVAT